MARLAMARLAMARLATARLAIDRSIGRSIVLYNTVVAEVLFR